MNEELRNYIKNSNLLSLNSFDDSLELNLTELYFYLQLPIILLDDSLDFWDKRLGNNNKEGLVVELNWNKWESFDFIDSNNLSFIKKVRKDLKEFEKEQYESLLDQDEWKFPIYLKDEFILPRTIQSAFNLPSEQTAKSHSSTKDWKGTIETILSDDKLQQEFEDDSSMLKMFDLPEIDIALELNLAIPKETIIQIKELMIQNKSISKLDSISALLLLYEDDSDRRDFPTYVLPESPRSGSPPIFPRRQSDSSPSSTLSHANPIEIIQDLFDDNSKSQNQTQPPLLLTSPSGKEINMVDWNELEFIKLFPITSSSSSSPTHSTNAVKSNEAEMIWSSQTLEIQSSPPTDVGIEVPIFPRMTTSIKIKEEPIDEFKSQMRILLVDEESFEDEEDEIDELDEDDHIPGTIHSDELNTLLEAVILPAESSPNVETLAGDHILIESRLKIPILSTNSSMIPESESIFHFKPTSQLLFPYAPISNRSLSIDLSWQPFTMGLNDIKTIWDVVDDNADEEKEMMRSCDDFESFREKLEIVNEKEDCFVVDSVSSTTPTEFEIEEEDRIVPRVSEPISIPFASTITTVEEEVQQISTISTSPSVPTHQPAQDYPVSVPAPSQESSLPLPNSSFVDIISTQRVIPEVGKTLLECTIPTKRTVDDSFILEDEVMEVVIEKVEKEKIKPTSVMEIIEILSSSESEEEEEEEEDNDIQIIEQPGYPQGVVSDLSGDELVAQDLIIPTSLEYIRKETSDDNTSKTWSSGNALAQFLVSKGKHALTQPKLSNNRPQVASISKSTSTTLKLPLLSVTSTQRPLNLPFTIPSYLSTTSTKELPLASYRIIALPEILQLRSLYTSLLISGITLIDRSSQFHPTPHIIQEPHLILDSNTCVVFFQLIKLVGNVYRKEEIDLLLTSDGGEKEEEIYWRGLKRDEAVFTSICRLNRSYEKVVCIFEEISSTFNSISTTKSKRRDFAYTKPVLDALDLLASTIQDQLSSKHGVDIAIVKDPEESTQVVKKCLTSLLLVEAKEGEVEAGRLWLTDDPTVNEIRSLQVLEQLNPFSACYNLAKYGDSMVDFISLDDDSRRLVFEKAGASGRSVSVAGLITTMNTIRQDMNYERTFDSREEVQGRSFDEMEDEYEGQGLKGTQEESSSFSEVFDYDTYDYDTYHDNR